MSEDIFYKKKNKKILIIRALSSLYDKWLHKATIMLISNTKTKFFPCQNLIIKWQVIPKLQSTKYLERN